MINDVMRFLDNVLSDFINRAPDQFADAKYSAEKERSVGLGVMGFHSYLQKNNVPLESVMSKVWNKKIFKHIQEKLIKLLKIWLKKEEHVLMLLIMVLMKDFQIKLLLLQQLQFQLFVVELHQE